MKTFFMSVLTHSFLRVVCFYDNFGIENDFAKYLKERYRFGFE